MNSGAPSRHPSVRILVVGDSGVGKTSLVHLLCHNEVAKNVRWTVGCNTDCKLHEYSGSKAAGTSTFFIDFWDVAGASRYHELSRAVFFQSTINGVIFVHDLSNRKSFKNLLKWGREIQREVADQSTFSPGGTVQRRGRTGSGGASNGGAEKNGGGSGAQDYSRNQNLPVPLLGTVPVVVIGNKADLPVTFESTVETQQRRTHRLIMEEFGVSTNDFLQSSASNGVFDHVHMDAFFNRAIDHKLGSMVPGGALKPAKALPQGYSRRSVSNSTSVQTRSPTPSTPTLLGVLKTPTAMAPLHQYGTTNHTGMFTQHNDDEFSLRE